MKCLSCGHNNPDEAKFCNNCGEKLFLSDSDEFTSSVNEAEGDNQNVTDEINDSADNESETVITETGESEEYEEKSSAEYDSGKTVSEPEVYDKNSALKPGMSAKWVIAIVFVLTAIIIAGIFTGIKFFKNYKSSHNSAGTTVSSISDISQKTTTEKTAEETITTTAATTAKPKEEYIVDTKSDPLRMRKEPNTDSKIITNIPKGTKLTVSETKNGWSKVTFKGKTGWVSNDFLKKVKNDDKSDTEINDYGNYSTYWEHNYFVDEFGDLTGEGFYSAYAYDVVCESSGVRYYDRTIRVLIPENPYQNECDVLFEIKDSRGNYDFLFSDYEGAVKDANGNKNYIKAYRTYNKKYLSLYGSPRDRFYEALKTGKAEVYLNFSGSETYSFSVDKGNLETKMSLDSLITTTTKYVYTTTWFYTEPETTTRQRVKLF